MEARELLNTLKLKSALDKVLDLAALGMCQYAEPQHTGFGFNEYTTFIKHLEEAQPQQGWLVFQSKSIAFTDPANIKDALSKNKPHGYLLYGEFIQDENNSIHIRQDGSGGWIVTRYTEDSGEIEAFVETVKLISIHHGDKNPEFTRLKYRVYWQLEEPKEEELKEGDLSGRCFRQVAARFCGFEGVQTS
jgi:hypothetical protein